MIYLLLLSFVFVSFGQPVYSSLLCLVTAIVGYVFFFAALLRCHSSWHRFFLGLLFGTGVQMVQLSWLLSHPYSYIIGVHLFLSLLFGGQVGFLSVLVVRKNIEKWLGILGLASIWAIMEWSRLFALAGFSFNPAGLALTGNLYSLQMASLFGSFGLSFWVIFVNLTFLRFWMVGWNRSRVVSLALLASLPYAYGFFQLNFIKTEEKPSFPVVLVQTAFPAEEAFGFQTREEMIEYVLGEWKQIFTNLKEHFGKKTELVILPEGAVPFGTYSFVFDYSEVSSLLKEIYGEAAEKAMPPRTLPWVYQEKVNNAFLSQTIAHLFDSGVLIGLEDASDVFIESKKESERQYYVAAQYFQPGFSPSRYEKRVLVPLGEYIPFTFIAQLCSKYGVQGSMTPGAGAKLMKRGATLFGPTICYEETFGEMMRENRRLGADLLVNITSDVWYPNSSLPQVHFDHAKLRTVEMGIPLARACNTGVTGVIDSFGRNVAILGEGEKNQEWLSKALYVKVPMKSYSTLYSRFGDFFIIGLCFLFSLCFFLDLKAPFSIKWRMVKPLSSAKQD